MDPLETAALRLVPERWREDVARDLAEERTPGSGRTWLLVRAVEIGTRLRLMQAMDAIRDLPRQRWRFPMTDVISDLRFAVRSAVRQPAYAVAVIATLAVGIGANTAIYSVFNWILFRPLPGVAAPDRLVTVRYQSPKSDGRFFMPYLDHAELRDRVTSLSGLAGSLPLTVHVARTPAEDGARFEAEVVTADYFDVLGVQPARGRSFLPGEEHTVESTPPIVIADRLWKGQFDRDPAALGRILHLDGHPFVIAGIAPPDFQGRSLVTRTDLWVPLGAHRILMPHLGADTLTSRRGTLFGNAIGRLRPGVSLATAQAEATAIAEASTEFSTRPGRPKSSLRPVLYAGLGHDTYARERIVTMFNLLMGAVGLLLLLACANAANLLLARTTSRRRELAVRQAIGAGRFRIIRQQLAEGFVLSIAAGIAGLAIARGLTWLFDGMRILSFLPALEGVEVDWRVAAFALAASVVTAGLFATVPALAGSRIDLLTALKDGQTTTRSSRPTLRATLVLLQISVSVVLLAAAGLFVRTLNNLRALPLGMDISSVTTFRVDPSRLGHKEERSQQMLGEGVRRMAAVPGVESVGFTWAPPFANMRAEMAFATPGAPGTWHEAGAAMVSPGYFRTMRIPLLAGRDFTDAEFGRLNTASGVVILGETLARRLFPAGGAVGSRLKLNYPEKMEVEVIGIAGDVRGRVLGADPEPFAYEPAGQRWATTWGSLVVRSSLPPTEIAAQARRVIRELDPAFTPPVVESFGTLLESVLAEQRLVARLSVVFGGVAMLLAGIGIYAMMAGSVAERRREFGIRLALGASAGAVQRQVLQRAVLLGAAGVAAGTLASVAARRAIEARLFGVTPLDPATFAAAAVTIVTLCAIASLVPAVRAGRVDPVRSLRVE